MSSISLISFLMLLPISSWGVSLSDHSNKSFKTSTYEALFSVKQSEHSTRNELVVSFLCLKTKKETKESFQLCNFDLDSVKIKKIKNRHVVSFNLYSGTNWGEYYENMEKNEKNKPQCDQETVEKIKIEIKGCP